MRKLLLITALASTAMFAAPAFAGPDGDIIQHNSAGSHQTANTNVQNINVGQPLTVNTTAVGNTFSVVSNLDFSIVGGQVVPDQGDLTYTNPNIGASSVSAQFNNGTLQSATTSIGSINAPNVTVATQSIGNNGLVDGNASGNFSKSYDLNNIANELAANGYTTAANAANALANAPVGSDQRPSSLTTNGGSQYLRVGSFAAQINDSSTQTATTNVNGSGIGVADISSLAVGNNLSFTSGWSGSLTTSPAGGTSAASYQGANGISYQYNTNSVQTADLTVGSSISSDGSKFSSQAVGNNVSIDGIRRGDGLTFQINGGSITTANLNVSSGTFNGASVFSAQAVGNSVSVDGNASALFGNQSNTGSFQVANVNITGGSFGAITVNNTAAGNVANVTATGVTTLQHR